MNWTIVGQSDPDAPDTFLVSTGGALGSGEEKGRILDLEQGKLFPEGRLAAISKFNEWFSFTGKQSQLKGYLLQVQWVDDEGKP